jgi:hypothetical protein
MSNFAIVTVHPYHAIESGQLLRWCLLNVHSDHEARALLFFLYYHFLTAMIRPHHSPPLPTVFSFEIFKIY